MRNGRRLSDEKNKTYGNILIIGIIGLMLYNIGYGVGTAIYRIFG